MKRSELARHAFVRSLMDPQLDRLIPCAREQGFEEGETLFREGGVADRIYLVLSGRVVLEQHVPGRGEVQVESFSEGDIVGLSWMFPEARWTLDARCATPVRAFTLHADCLRERMKEDPRLAAEILGNLVEALYRRLVHVRLQRLDVYRTEG